MLSDEAREILRVEWAKISALAEAKKLKDWLSNPKLLEAVNLSTNSPTKTYRYVLPTQVLSKLADSSLDSRCLQASRGGYGAFDARTVAHEVIVPFDQQNENVLGGSQEPYVSNPLRVSEVSAINRGAQKNKLGLGSALFRTHYCRRKEKHGINAAHISANPYRNLQTPVDGSGCLPSAQTSKPRKDDRCDSDVSLRALWWRPSSGTFVSVVHDYWPAIPALRKSKERKNHGCRSGQRDAVGPGMRHERWPHRFCC